MRTTLKDVARKAGVSMATVSLVLNGKVDEISIATQELVKKAAEELDYVPNLTARRLQSTQSHLLALLVPDLHNEFYTRVAEGATRRAYQANYLVNLSALPPEGEETARLLQMLRGEQFAGMLVVSRKFRQIRNELARKNHIPFVMLDEMIDDKLVSSLVTGDNEAGGRMVAEYFIKKGHRRFACITGPDETPNSIRRLSGFIKALNEHGLRLEEKYIFEGDYTASSGFALAEQVRDAGVTSVFAFNDLMAIGCMRGLHLLGVRVPEDISFVGYDALAIGKYLTPQLTTVDQDAFRIGAEGVDALIRQMDGTEEQTKILIPPIFMERETVIEQRETHDESLKSSRR